MRAPSAEIPALWLDHIAIIRQADDRPAGCTAGRGVGWWVLQFPKVVLIGPIPGIHLRLKALPAFGACRPQSNVAFVMMVGAEGELVVVPVATIACEREHRVLSRVVADPVPAAWGPREVLGRPAETALRRHTVIGTG